jgi:hypothetical protein
MGTGTSMIGEDNFEYMLDHDKNNTPSPNKKKRRNSSVGDREPTDPTFDDVDV